MRPFDEQYNFQATVAVSSEQLNEGKLFKEEEDEGRQVVDVATTGNSTKFFYNDGTTETVVHPLGPDSGAKPDIGGRQATGGVTTGNSTKIFYDDGATETTYHPITPEDFTNGPTPNPEDFTNGPTPAEPEICVDFPVAIDYPQIPWTIVENPDGTTTAVHGNPNNLPFDGGPVSIELPPTVPWTATVNPDGTIEAVHGNPNNIPVDAPEVCEDFPADGPLSFDVPAQTPWTAKVNPDGTITAQHGNPDNLPVDAPEICVDFPVDVVDCVFPPPPVFEVPDCIFLPPPTPWVAKVNPDGTITAQHGNPDDIPVDAPEVCEDFPVDFTPDICVDFPVAELTYVSNCGPVPLAWQSDCGMPELLAEQTVLDEAISIFIADTTVETSPNDLVSNETQELANVNDASVSLADAMDTMVMAAIGIENV